MFSARCLCSEKRRKRINGEKCNKADISEINRMHFIGAYGLYFYITEILIALCFFVIGFFGILAVHLYFEQRS